MFGYGTCNRMDCSRDTVGGRDNCFEHKVKNNGDYPDEVAKKGRIIGYTTFKIWTPFKDPKLFFSGLGAMLLSIPFTLDQLHIWDALHSNNPFATGWTSAVLSPVFAGLGVLGLLAVIWCVMQQEFVPIAATPEEDEYVKLEAQKAVSEYKLNAPVAVTESQVKDLIYSAWEEHWKGKVEAKDDFENLKERVEHMNSIITAAEGARAAKAELVKQVNDIVGEPKPRISVYPTIAVSDPVVKSENEESREKETEVTASPTTLPESTKIGKKKSRRGRPKRATAL